MQKQKPGHNRPNIHPMCPHCKSKAWWLHSEWFCKRHRIAKLARAVYHHPRRDKRGQSKPR